MSIDTATHLWIEAGNMSGGSRNQIEFSDELIAFFDKDSVTAGKIFVAYDKSIKAYCPLSNRGQEYGQWTNIWRLGLITKAKGGVDYQCRVLSLERRPIGKAYVYVITVTDAESALHQEWQKKSIHSGTTGGPEGRAYGYY